MTSLLLGMASGKVEQMNPESWEQIPHQPVRGYNTDYAGNIINP
ncbi:hypothetical protein [Crystallibacter crystallopoietes]|nr:hypothetical protein [Arthrobacter crystallopoietes]